MRRALPLLLALGLASQAHAGDPWSYCTPYWEEMCGGVAATEPKDVACMLSHDCVQADNLDGYRWYRVDGQRILCGETHTQSGTTRGGSPWTKYARPKINPYQFTGDCYPRLGELRTYVVRAVDDAGQESVNDSNPYTVIGASICCADSTGWVACWPGAAPCRFP